MTGCTQGRNTIPVMAPRDAENRMVPLDTKVLYNDKGIEFEVSSLIFGTSKYGVGWDVECFTSDSDCIYTRPLDSMYLEKPDSLKQLAEDLNRAINYKSGYVYSSASCAYMNHNDDACERCKFRKTSDICSMAMLKDIADRVNRLAGDSE